MVRICEPPSAAETAEEEGSLPSPAPRSALSTSPTRGSGARLVFGLLGLFVVYLSTWLALWTVVPPLVLGWTAVVITSESMAPRVRLGDVVVASPYDGRPLGPGAVVVFSDPARPGLLTHRIVKPNPDGSYLTQGDANPGADSTPLPADRVVGVGRLLVPLVGLPMAWYWTGAWGRLALWGTATLGSLWATRYALSDRYLPEAWRAQP